MPKAIKKKPEKKKAPQEENVKSAALEAVEKIKERQKQLITGLGALFAVLVLVFIISFYSSSKTEEAMLLEQEAYKLYYGELQGDSMTNEARWKDALQLFEKSVSVKATPSALYYVGNSYMNLSDYDNAINAYTQFTDKFSGDLEILPLVYQKLSSAYFQSGQNDKALETLSHLSKVSNGVFGDTALILEARFYDRAGEKEKALEKYKEVMAEFPSSLWSTEANAKVSSEEEKETTPSNSEAGSSEGIVSNDDQSSLEPQGTAAE